MNFYTKSLFRPRGGMAKILLVMRLIIVLLTTAIMQVSAMGYAQKVTLKQNNARLTTVLDEIRRQTGFDFVYSDKVMNTAKPVSLNVTNAELNDALEICFKDQPLSFKVEDKMVIIQPKGPSLASVIPNSVQDLFRNIDVRGRVVDEQGNPLPNASIQVKGKAKVYNSNDKGEFSIPDVVDDAVLVIRYVGYRMLEIEVKDAVMPLEIKLNVATGELEEVNVTYSTGYQNIPKERATGSFVQLTNEDINRTVSTNLMDRILNITNSLKNESLVGGLSIRGTSTLKANKLPLLVIDGFPNDEGSNTDIVIYLNNLNPNDVEDITILRDAAAASIWGARAANGVIVITTKKGRYNQAAKVQLTTNVNITKRPDLFKANIMSSADAIAYEKNLFATGIYNDYDDAYPSSDYFPVVSPAIEILLAKRRNAITQEQSDAQLNQLANHDTRNDVNKYLIRNALNQQYNLNISGGSNKMNYYGSVGYDRNLGTSIGNDYSRLTLTLNNTYRPIRNLELNTYAFISQNKSENNGVDYSGYLANGGTQVTPYMMLADEHGIPLHLNQTLRAAYIDSISTKGLLDWHFYPIDEIKNNDFVNTGFNARIGAGIRYSIIDGLRVDISGQYERNLSNIDNYYSTETYYARNLINSFMTLNSSGQPQYPIPFGGILEYTDQLKAAYNLRGQLNLDKVWNKHAVSAIAGLDIKESEFDSNQSRKYGYDPLTLSYASNMDYKSSYQLRPSGMGSATIYDGNILYGTLNRYLSYYTNVGYTLSNKYTFTASGRIDASNFFGVKSNLKAIPLWSVGGAWDISKEKFFTSKTVNFLKLRATYGFNGNLDNRATSRPTIKYSPGTSSYSNFQLQANRVTPPNPGLTWEKVGMLNFGVDISSFDNRFNASLEFYSKKSDNLIGVNQIDPTVGITEYTGNYASIKGRGIDFMLSCLVVNKTFKFNTTLSVSWNIDKVQNIYLSDGVVRNGSAYLDGTFYSGGPIYPLNSYKWAGLNKLTGDPMGVVDGEVVPFTTVLGSTGNVSNTTPEDLVYHGRASAPFFGNVVNEFSYDGFIFSFNVVYRFGYYFRRPSVNYEDIHYKWGGHGDYALRWQKPGDELITNVPSMPAILDNRNVFYSKSEILVEKGDHVRLQDIRLAYNLNKAKIKKLPFSSASIFIYANNLGILWRSNKKKIDPDFYSTNIPAPRSVAFGLTLNY
jgi:TonB-linked SusC/RagA family outer membrane protein